MSKVERLVKLSRIKKCGEQLTVKQLSKECGVSERTVYRYLNTLSGLDLEREIRKAPPGSLRDRLRRLGLSPDDLTLVGEILIRSKWYRYPTLARSVRKVCRALELILADSPSEPSTYAPGNPTETVRMHHGSDSLALEKFVTALKSRRPVNVRYRGSRGKTRVLMPQRLLIESQRLGLELSDPASDERIVVSLDQVLYLGLTRVK